MSKSNTTRFTTRLVVFVITLALVGADLVVTGQNTNSSTTQDDSMSAPNTNMNMKRSSRRRRRGRRRSSMRMTNANAACGGMENANTAGEMQENTSGGMAAMTPRRYGRCDPTVQEQTDLSGTYTGTVNYTDGGLSGDATLTITNNDFSLTSGSSTQEGRVVAVTTCGYTAVTMMFGKSQTTAATGSQPMALPAVSLRARKTSSGITLMSVPGEPKQFSFSAAGAGGSPSYGRRRRRGRRRSKTTMSGNACGPMAHPVTVQ